jgi:hypothetical protein
VVVVVGGGGGRWWSVVVMVGGGGRWWWWWWWLRYWLLELALAWLAALLGLAASSGCGYGYWQLLAIGLVS